MSYRYRYEKREKHTGIGAVEKHIAYCPTCKTFAEPVDWRSSRRGTHSTVWFEHEHPLSFITLRHSSLGHSSVYFEGEIPETIRKAVVYLWVWERLFYEDVEEIIKDPQKLNEVLEEIKQLERPAPPPPSLEPNVRLVVQTPRGYGDTFVKTWDDRAPSIFDMPDCEDEALLRAVYGAVTKLEDRFKVPVEFSSGDYCLPRYFSLTVFFDGEKAYIVDIVNIRRSDGKPGRWSYRQGYWAPLVIDGVLYALDEALRKAQERRLAQEEYEDGVRAFFQSL
ncbi:MAG: hypothetical protein LM590_12420 [Thermofilum sp.]|nr:hypothetical protein [Thermofilum sp.]